jgi:N-acetylneuraminate synthase
MPAIKIQGRTITRDSPPYLIAEAGVNYYDIAKKMKIDLLDAAKLMIDEAKGAGADAIKFQTYKAEKLASKKSPAYWDLSKEPTKSQYELFKKFDHFEDADWKALHAHSKKKGIVFLSTPFDMHSVDILDRLVPVFKISSSDLTNIPFIKYIARKRKPILLSVGASNMAEIYNAVSAIEEEGNEDIALLHCILSYPTKDEDANLGMIRYLREAFPGKVIGYSDHTMPDRNMLILTQAYLLGATIIEKHYTLDKTLTGNDHYHGMDPDDIRVFKANLELLAKIQGGYFKQPVACELNSRKYARRSIVAKRDLEKGHVLTLDDIDFKRPGVGISPEYYTLLLGKALKAAVKEDDFIPWEAVL